MYRTIKLMTMSKKGERTLGLAAVALVAFILLTAWPMEARGQNTYGGATVVHAGSIGIVPGQSVSVSVPNFYFQDGSVKFVKHAIKVYIENQSTLVYSGESGVLEHEVGHVFTFRHEHTRPERSGVAGDPVTGRVQLWIEIESFPPVATENQTEDGRTTVAPTFELIDDQTGRTVLSNALGKSVSLSLRARPELSSGSDLQ